MKTEELTGAELDYWVAKAEGLEAIQNLPRGFFYWEDQYAHPISGWFTPSKDWMIGGPLIERERIAITPAVLDEKKRWVCKIGDRYYAHGNTPLEAAMRTLVKSKFGDEVSE